MYFSSLIGLVPLVALTVMAFPTHLNDLYLRGQYPNEVVFLSHCYGNNVDQGTLMAYYQSQKGYPNGRIPDAWAVIDSKNQIGWEGVTRHGTFSGSGAGTTGTSKISGNAGGMSKKQYAGSFSNSWGQAFNCYKDTESWLYNCYNSPIMNGKATDCYAEYYCYDAN